MRRLAPLLMLLIVAAPAPAQREPEWRTASEHDVLLRPWAIEPKRIRLEAGQPVRLRFVNQGQATHSFSSARFFRSARLRPRDRDIAVRGGLRLAPGEERVVALVPARGHYGAGSRNALHWAFGMRAEILVE